MSYGKIFETVFSGTLFGSGPTVFAVWAYVIATAKPPGVVEINAKMLAACIGTDIGDVKRAIELLCEPDPDSRNPDYEGRRLVHLGGMQYQVVSFQKYRDMRDLEAKRAADRERIAQKRREMRAANGDNCDMSQVSPPVAIVSPPVASGRQVSPQAEAEKEKNPPTPRKRGQGGALFALFWSAYPRKVSKGAAERAFASLNPTEQLVGRMCAAIERAKTSAQWRKNGGEFVPYPATWIRAKGWEDEPPDDDRERTRAELAEQDDWLRRAI